MEDGNMEKKLRTVEEEEEEEEEELSKSSSSDTESLEANGDGGEEKEDEFGLSAGFVVSRGLRGRSDPVPGMSMKEDAQKAETKSSTKRIELQTVQHDYQFHVAPNQNAIMPSRMGGGLTDQPERNLPIDQSLRGSAMSKPMHATQNTNYNFPMHHSSTEHRTDSSQVPTQITGDGFAERAQWVEWHHLQQQLTWHDPSMLPRQDSQGQGYIPRDGVFTENGLYTTGTPPFGQHPSVVSQQGLGDYNTLSSASPTLDPVLLPANFTGSLGMLGSNLEANRLIEGREPFGHSQMNAGYADLVHPGHRYPQLSARPVSPVQVNQGRNRFPVPNSIYDPMYEALGLPVDPHLRLFLASQRDSGR